MNDKIRLGVSSCLVGQKVRFDGGHKLDRYLVDILGQYVEFVPVCPEVEVGLSTPRPALRQVDDGHGGVRLVFSKTGEDITDTMQQWAKCRVQKLESEQLDGFVFKSNSPSSGMERVKVYTLNGMPRKNGVGLFARAFMDHFPLLPVEEEGRLHDPHLRENFICRIFTLLRFRKTLERGRYGDIVEFHSHHKLLILSHSEKISHEMGRLVANGNSLPISEFTQRYKTLLLSAIQLKTTPSKHTNVLHHILGYFKKQLTADEKQEAIDIIQNFKDDLLPLIVPITLMNHYVRKYDQSYLKTQLYLHPHPKELKLLNHV